MDIQEIFSEHLRTLPYKKTFTSNGNGNALLYVAASMTPKKRAGIIGLNVKIDGKQVANPEVFSNEIGSSRPLVAALARFPAELGEHTVTLEAANDNSGLGDYDYACGTVFYSGRVEPFLWRFKGPVPQSVKFKSPMSGMAVLFFAGSGYIKTQTVCGLSVMLDGKAVAKTQEKASIGTSHLAFPPQFVPINLQVQEYEIGISPTVGELQTDGNDTFEIGIFY